MQPALPNLPCVVMHVLWLLLTVTEEQEAHCDAPCHNSTDTLKQWVKEADGKRSIFPQGGETYQIQSRDGRELP